MCIKAVDDYANALEFVPDRYKTQGMCNKVVSENPFLLKYSHDNIRLKKYVIKSLMSFPIVLQVNRLKNFLLLCTQIMVYYFMMKTGNVTIL